MAKAQAGVAALTGKSDSAFTARTRLRDRPVALIRVRRAAGNPSRGWLLVDHLAIPVALGRGGIYANKREGDGTTPVGTFRPRRLWWRRDRGPRPQTALPTRAIRATDAWCEDPGSRHYNQPVQLTADSTADRLMRADHLYDYVVEIDHNTRPRIAGHGSAVFLHLARPGFQPTAGCVSMTRPAMLRLLARLSPATRIVIG